MTADVLLINPPWVTKDSNLWHGIKSAMPPLGLLSVASYAEQQGLKVRVIDAHVEKLSITELGRQIKETGARTIGITVMTGTANAANRIARLVKEVTPESLLVFGGVHAEVMTSECFKNSAVDVVVRGDGEEAFVKIARGVPLDEIRGISYFRAGAVVHNPSAPLQMDLDRFPFPAYHLVPMHLYYPAVGAYKKLPAINMLMTRGCPGKCTYCNSAMTTLRTRSAESVVAEIKWLKSRYGIREIQFYDDTFTVMKKNVMRFCELMAREKLGVTWSAFIRSDCFSEEMALAMKRAGCHQVMIGVESGDEQILRNIRKPIDHERTAATIRIARRAGIDTRAAFMFGNQGETANSMQRTIDFSIELDPDIALFNVCTPYPGTQLFSWAKANGHLLTEEWSEYELSNYVMKLPTVSAQEIRRFYEQAHKQFFMRPIAIWRRLVRITRLSHLRDMIHAFFFIVLRIKLGSRGEFSRDWIGMNKGDFFDREPANCDTATAKLTYEERQRAA